MKVVIFAGGLGTRLAEFTENIPKPLVKNWYYANYLAYYEKL